MIIGTEEIIDEQKFFSCSCYSEGILVSDFKDDSDFDIYLAMYSHGLVLPNRGLKDRIKYAWKHIMTGKVWEDEVILTPETASKLGKYLIERAEYQNNKKQTL